MKQPMPMVTILRHRRARTRTSHSSWHFATLAFDKTPYEPLLTLVNSADKKGEGGHATEGADSSGGAKKAKQEFPEAPDTIGMQDERGGRGG
jgi:hypothetical protein